MKRGLQLTLAAAAALAFALPTPASASDDEVRHGGQCTGGSSSKIKAKPDDGRLEVEFEVDQNRSGQKWKVKIKDNSDTVFKGSARTHGRSGSFEIERHIANRSGSDHITGIARSKHSGERCAASLTI